MIRRRVVACRKRLGFEAATEKECRRLLLSMASGLLSQHAQGVLIRYHSSPMPTEGKTHDPEEMFVCAASA
jgi:hypothetical protein